MKDENPYYIDHHDYYFILRQESELKKVIEYYFLCRSTAHPFDPAKRHIAPREQSRLQIPPPLHRRGRI